MFAKYHTIFSGSHSHKLGLPKSMNHFYVMKMELRDLNNVSKSHYTIDGSVITNSQAQAHCWMVSF